MSAHNDRQAELARIRRDALAELVAEGSTVKAAGQTLGLSREVANNLWRRIRADLGSQAV